MDTPHRSAFDSTEPIAIVGVGCKLPGNVSTVEDLLEVLREGRDCITELPSDRWDVASHYDPDPLAPGKTYVRHGGFVADIDRFDAAFFGITDGEADRMDPQQRLALQTVWHALEHAGQAPERLAHTNTGVFLAMMNTNCYQQLKYASEGMQGLTAYDAICDAGSIAAGRIAHFLGLEGPCLTVDTACSGSMVALHLARQSILAGDCDAAIVAGVTAILDPGFHIASTKAGVMSRSGRCRAFDADADGFVRGEGCVAVILRRESEALARGDHILASIVGTAVNQDGRTPAITTPNGRAQENVMRMALHRAGADPSEIGYVEAHGTGTPVGDPIEMSAIANVYGITKANPNTLFVGSAKSNFGHIESGAGLLGIVKAALSLDHELIFPSINFGRLSPHIDLGGAPVQVPTSTIPWRRGQRPRMAGANSFGYSGTNAHVVMREAPLVARSDADEAQSSPHMVVLSAKSDERLQELVDGWADYLERDEAVSLADIAFTAATGRTHMRHRLAVVGRGKEEISDKLRLWRFGRNPKGLTAARITAPSKLKIAFVFTGQGAQYPEMGLQLYKAEPTFKAAIDRCAALMDPELGLPLREVLFGSSAAEALEDTSYVQPALFAVEYALADLLRQWGVEPDLVIGHSVGEIVAACVAGIFDLESAVRFVVARGRLMGQLPRDGKMLAVDATPEQVQEWINGKEDQVALAAVNGPSSVVVSGSSAAVEAVGRRAYSEGHRITELKVSHAFHSPLMDPILEELQEIAASASVSQARLPLISNVTGAVLSDDATDGYWASHARKPVLFYEGMRNIVDSGCSLIIEVGPHPTLTPTIAGAFNVPGTRWVPTLLRDRQDSLHILETLGALFVTGVPLDSDRLFSDPTRHRVSLPVYPFRRDRHWFNTNVAAGRAAEVFAPRPEASAKHPEVRAPLHPLLGQTVSLGARRAVFESTISVTPPWGDHRVLGTTVFPGTGYLEMAARGYAAFRGHDWLPVVLRDVAFERPLVLAYGKPSKLKLTLEDTSSNGTEEAVFTIAAEDSRNAQIYCRGRIGAASEDVDRVPIDIELGHMASQLAIGSFYGELRQGGLEYGSSFSTIRELWMGRQDSGEALGRVTASFDAEEEDIHPFTVTTMLDGCLQVFGSALQTLDRKDHQGAFVPASIRAVTLRRQLPSQVWSHVSVRTNGDGRAALVQIRVLSDEGDVLADIDTLELRQKARFSPLRDDGELSTKVAQPVKSGVSQSRDELVARLQDLPHKERVAVVADWLTAEVKDTLGETAEDLDVDLDDLDPSTALLEIGLDSLLVTELQRRIQEKLEFRFQPMQGLDYQSIESLAEYVIEGVLALEPTADAVAASSSSSSG
jgi:acyl transferase domain-containing protein